MDDKPHSFAAAAKKVAPALAVQSWRNKTVCEAEDLRHNFQQVRLAVNRLFAEQEHRIEDFIRDTNKWNDAVYDAMNELVNRSAVPEAPKAG